MAAGTTVIRDSFISMTLHKKRAGKVKGIRACKNENLMKRRGIE
jgi:hypothetical protein